MFKTVGGVAIFFLFVYFIITDKAAGSNLVLLLDALMGLVRKHYQLFLILGVGLIVWKYGDKAWNSVRCVAEKKEEKKEAAKEGSPKEKK